MSDDDAERLSLSERHGGYLESVADFLGSPAAFSAFRRDPRYRAILEHVEPDLGRAYLDLLRSESPDLVERIAEIKDNDAIGSPELHDYEGIGAISPSTLRYAYIAGDLRNRFGDLSGFAIAEIGAGYGGQLLLLDRLFAPREYLAFDLPPVLELIETYLARHRLTRRPSLLAFDGFGADRRFDLALSCFAFSELPPALQRRYAEQVLAHSDRGYLLMNTGTAASEFRHHLQIEDLRALLPPFEISEERPRSGPANYLVTWGC